MFNSGLWYSMNELDSAMQDLKNKLEPVYKKTDKPFESWWNELTFGSYKHSIDEILNETTIKNPRFFEIIIRRVLKAVPALSCCLGEYTSDLILQAIFSKSYSSEESASIESSFSELPKDSVTDILKDYLVPPIITTSTVWVSTFFSTMISEKAIYKKDWGTAIWDALKSSGVWSAAYVSSAVGGFAGLLFKQYWMEDSEIGEGAVSISTSLATLSFTLIGVKFLADKVRKIIGCYRKSNPVKTSEPIELVVENDKRDNSNEEK